MLDSLYATVGCHPTRCSEFENTKEITPQEYLQNLSELILDNPVKVAAIGEFGLGKNIFLSCHYYIMFIMYLEYSCCALYQLIILTLLN